MPQSWITRLAAVAFLLAMPVIAQAQKGRIVGAITDSTKKQPIAGAQIIVSPSGLSTETGTDGKIMLQGVPAGSYEVRVYRLGYKSSTVRVLVTAGQDATVAIAMTPAAANLAGVVVSASRRLEKVTEAPATITRLDDQQIANSIGNSFAPALKDVKGLDFIQTGVMSTAVNARGFNSSFNNRMLMMEDGRIATLAESGLPVGALTTIPKVDLAGVEVLVGPGSALYGPDASSGVITLQTKDPRQFPGTTVEIAGGSRDYMDAQARWAGTNGSWGYKLTGEYQAANDFSNTLVYPTVATPTGQSGPLAERGADWRSDVTRANGTLAYYFSNGSRLQAVAGLSKLNGIGQTNVGRNQLINYGYRNYQLQYVSPRWFAQTYLTNSLPGSTFQLNGFTQNSARYPTINPDSVKKLSAFPGDGRVYAAEVQNNFALGMLHPVGVSAIDNMHLTYGVQVRRDRVSSYRHWLSDRQTGKAILNDQTGFYAQIESPLTSMVKVVAAGRYDKPSKYDAQFSPKGAVLFTPWSDQTFRVSFNRAFKSPTVLQTDFFYPDFQPAIGVFGNTHGFEIRNGTGAGATVLATYNPIRPELNDTWELGYKGIIQNRLYVDITGYRTKFTDFMSPLVVIANPFGATPTYAFDKVTGQRITNEAGGNQIPLTYFNVGQAWMRGIDAGVKFYLTETISASTNASFISLDSIKRGATDPVEATSFNSPSSRITTGMEFARLPGIKNLTSGFTARYVSKYSFRSGINYGTVPAFGTVDLGASYRVRNDARVILQASNLYACTGGTTTMPATGVSSAAQATYAKSKKCGFGQRHQEMINMPEVGAIVLAGFRWDVQ